jgi:hypothetical protein
MQQHQPTPLELFCTLRRTYQRIHNMQNDTDCPIRDVRDETAFAASLEFELDNTMHNMVFASGFWAMLSAFITARQAMFQEIATMHSTTVSHVKASFFEGLLDACNTLQNTPVPSVQWWMRLPFQRRPAIAIAHVPIIVFGQEIALLRWRNQSGVMYVFEIIHRNDLEQML